MKGRRALPITVAALIISLLPVSGALAAPQPYYLHGGSVPSGVLSLATLPDTPLPNYDPGRDSEPGLSLERSTKGASETDPDRFQQWSLDASGATLSVNGLRIWAAAKDFDRTKNVRFGAYLMDCATVCEILDSSTALVRGSIWKVVSLPLSANARTFGDGHSLVVKIVVLEDSDDAMWFAYGTSTFDASLKLNVTAMPPATSPTTSTTPTATSTSRPGPTTSTPGPATTTTSPGKATTTSHGIGGPPSHAGGPSNTRPAGRPNLDQTIDTIPVTTTLLLPVTATTSAQLEPEGLASTVVVNPGRSAGPSDSPESPDEAMEIFRTVHELEPAEGLAVAFSTVTENISLYWQAAVGTGGVASLLLWVGLSRRREGDDLDDDLEKFE